MVAGFPTRMRRAALLPLFLFALAAPACRPKAPTLHERTDLVMGTVSQLKVVAADEEAARNALQNAYDQLSRIELLTTVHSEMSDVSRLNAHMGENVAIADEVEEIFDLAFDVQARSDSAFSPALGAVIQAWGFPEHPAVPEKSALRAALRKKQYDLGGIAKGYAVDRAADVLGAAGGCVVNVGGDLAVRGTRPDGGQWLIGVQDPRDPSELFLKLRLAGGLAVATSGDYQRYVEVDGVRYHHILDPHTGWPARGVRSVSVVAPTCALADAWATAAFVLGPVKGLAKLEEHPKLEGVLVEEDDEGRLVLHQTSGFRAFVEETS